MHAHLRLLITATGLCLTCALPAEAPSASDMRDFYEGSAEAGGAQMVRNLPITAVILPGKPYSDEDLYRSAALVLLKRHPSFKPGPVTFWQPTVDEARQGFNTVLKASSEV